MNVSINRSLAIAYETDLVEALAKARKGQLSPAQQEYCFEEIGKLKGTQEYPNRGDALLAELREVLCAKPQITDRQQAEKEYAEKGIELLFFMSLDRYTFAEITYLKEIAKYDGRIYINGSKHQNDLAECIAAMRKKFLQWLNDFGIKFARDEVKNRSQDPCDGRFETLQEAIALIYDGLNNPNSLL